jgi:hypothetical protein
MAFSFRLERKDGTPADPPTLQTGRTRLGRWRQHPAGPGTRAFVWSKSDPRAILKKTRLSGEARLGAAARRQPPHSTGR